MRRFWLFGLILLACEEKGSTVEKLNRLAKEKSPYLRQHATNPVDWYPWGKEALDKAKKENVFLEAMFMESVMGEGNPGEAMTPEFYAFELLPEFLGLFAFGWRQNLL